MAVAVFHGCENSKKMISLNFGDDTFSSGGFINTAQMSENNKGKTSKNGLYKLFSWGGVERSSLKDSSVCEARFRYTLERMEPEQGQSLMWLLPELYRICAHGAHIEIVTAPPAYIRNSGDPAVCRTITADTLKFLDADLRSKLATSDTSRLTCRALDELGINFRLLSTQCQFSHQLMAEYSGTRFNNDAELNAFIAAHEDQIVNYTFHLVCIKEPGQFFGLIRLPDAIRSIRLRDESELNRALPEGVRWRGDLSSYLMRTFDPSVFHGYIASAIATRGCWEPDDTLIVAELIRIFADHKDSFTMANIGANIGWYSVLAARMTGRVRIDAFEPNPETLELLKDNVIINQLENQITVHGLALSDKKGEVDFHVNHNNDGGSSIHLSAHNQARDQTVFEKITVPTDSMENIFYGRGKDQWPDLIVIDVEGHEQFVFNGSWKMFDEGFRPVIFAEFCPYLMELAGGTTWWRDLMEKYGYSVYVVSHNGQAGMIRGSLDELQQLFDNIREVKDGEDPRLANIILVPDFMKERNGTLAFKEQA